MDEVREATRNDGVAITSTFVLGLTPTRTFTITREPARYLVAGSFSARVPNPGWAMSFSMSLISTGTKADMFS